MGLQAITYKKNYYLSHRGLIETVFDCLKTSATWITPGTGAL